MTDITRLLRSAPGLALVLSLTTFAGAPARAVDVQGTVGLQGAIVFAAPIPGIAPEDVILTPSTASEATANGVKCSILTVTSDNASVGSTYPDAGAVTAEVLMERGGPQQPEGGCFLTLRAAAWDGAVTTARGSQTVLVDAATVGANGLVAMPDITMRESSAIAGVERECKKWVKKQLKKRAKCNFVVLKKGPETAVAKCKDAGPAPLACDPGLHVEEILAMSHGMNDQQVDPASGESVDMEILSDHVKCQKKLGKVAVKYASKRVSKVRKACVRTGLDSDDCRWEQSLDIKNKLDAIDTCIGNTMVDGGTGREVPDVGEPCDVCIEGSGVIDKNCMKACFQSVLDELSDGIVGDVPVCGDGILQGGEFCDDGNTADGDGCSALCGLEV
jgi:cysteine-rich repeat protein